MTPSPKDEPLPQLATACEDLKPFPGELVILEAGPEHGCPEAFGACFDAPNTAALAETLLRYRRWVKDAWIACGSPAPNEAPGSILPRRTRRLLFPDR